MSRPPCTCAGTAPGYPQHESYCGQVEHEDRPFAWWDDERSAAIYEGVIAEVMAALDED